MDLHERWYDSDEIEDILRRALELGFTLKRNSIILKMTVPEIECLVKYKI